MAAYSRVTAQPQITISKYIGKTSNLIKEEQHKEVEGNEDPEHSPRKNEQEGKELARAILNPSHTLFCRRPPMK